MKQYMNGTSDKGYFERPMEHLKHKHVKGISDSISVYFCTKSDYRKANNGPQSIDIHVNL
jgi:hypothetical protein